MKNKLYWSAFWFFILALFVQYFGLFRSPERKCPQYRPTIFDITFSHRKECLRIAEKTEPDPISEMNLDTLQEINFLGYNATSYTILSKDGYYSSVYRVSGNSKLPQKRRKRPILMYPPLASSGECWMIQPGSRNIVFTLVDAGYEVWLANIRGTAPSRNHTHLDPESMEYWDFGIKEISTLDLPLVVELILRETGADKMHYICYSSGCGIYLAALVDVPKLNNKFKAGFFLAPFAFYGSSHSPIMWFLRGIHGTPLEHLFYRAMGGKITTPVLPIVTSILGAPFHEVCSWSFMRCGVCDNLLFLTFGADPEQLDYENIPNFVRKFRGAGPLQIGFHAVQNDIACDFMRYDYGPTRNILEYGTSEPPSYNLSGVGVPTYIFYGESDTFVTPWDAAKTRDSIPSKFMKGFYKVNWPKFNHIDFLIAKDADVLVYHKVRDIINELEGCVMCT